MQRRTSPRALVWFAPLLSIACGAANPGPSGDQKSGRVLAVHNIDGSNAIAVQFVLDGRGNVFVAALQSGEADYGGGVVGRPTSEPPVLVLVKYNARIEHVWSKVYPAELSAASLALAATPGGDALLLVSGYGGALDPGAGPIEGHVLARFAAADGNLLWARNLSTDVAGAQPVALSCDAAGNVLVGGAATTSAPDDTLFVSKLGGEDAVVQWTARLATSGGAARASALATDPEGNVFAVGSFSGVLELDPQLDGGAGRILALKLGASSGTPMWRATLVPASVDEPVAACVGGAGDLVLAGALAAADETAPAPSVVRVVTLSGANGTPVWSASWGDDRAQTATVAALTSDVGGDLVVVGGFRGDLAFGAAPLSSPDHLALFVAKLAGEDGAPRWSRQSGDTGDVRASSVGTGADQHIMAGGTFETSPASADGSVAREVFLLELGP